MIILRKPKINPDLVSYIESKIIPLYKNFDEAHREDHIRHVIEESLSLSKYYNLDPNMVYTIASFHDIGLKNGRDNHEKLGGKILERDPFIKNMFSKDQIKIMKEAVEDHRASNNLEPRSIYGRIVGEADRIIDPEKTIERITKYGMKNFPEMNNEDQFNRLIDFLNKKYSEKGYIIDTLEMLGNDRSISDLDTDEKTRIKKFDSFLIQQVKQKL